MMNTEQIEEMPVISDIKDFDKKSGILLERLVFNNRIVFIAICMLLTILLGYQALHIKLSASFEKMIPHGHPYIKNYLANKGELPGLGNTVRVVVENTQGDIMNPDYLEILRQVNDEIFLTKGVDRAWVKSIWSPAVRWKALIEEGFQGGPVMPPTYDGSAESIAQLKTNIGNAGIMGSLIAMNSKSALIEVPLLERDPTGKLLDYSEFSQSLEKIRGMQTAKFRIHIIGFAKLVGDLIEGLTKVISFFAIAICMAGVIIAFYTRCLRSTITLLLCSLIAVCWLLGILVTFGFELNPYSILVPFLIFAIGISHGAQKMNGIMQDIGRGTHQLVAARYTFRRLFLAGLTALLADTVGFAVLMTIDIPVIKELALTASIGVAILIFTNLLLLPVMLSFIGVSQSAAVRSLREESDENSMVAKLCVKLSKLTERRLATKIVLAAAALAVGGFIVSLNLQIGDLDPGAPELRKHSRYNLDNAYITQNYSLTSDVFAVIVKTPSRGGMAYQTQIEMDRLAWNLEQLSGVQATTSATNQTKNIICGFCEGSPKWYTLPRNQRSLNIGTVFTIQNAPELSNQDVSLLPVIAYLKDHKAATLKEVVSTVENFAKDHNTPERQFLLAAGAAGIEAATNIVVKDANRIMMLYVYLAIMALCFITFRNWRAVLVAVIPLGITSILCEALMVFLGIGVKVATLPVIALGVGIGVDYALYLVSVQIKHQRDGEPLHEAYLRALRFTGKVVALVGVTLAAGVITWSFSPIKFQADMGILLSFMFLWNMIGALVLIPALSHFIMQTKWIAKN